MRFCENCNNMFYIRISDDTGNSLTYYCRNCGNEETNVQDDICVSKTHLKKGDDKYYNIINKYSKLDPTLPHVANVPCPNSKCECNLPEKNVPRDVIYKRYDDSELKYVYLCCLCDTIWHNNNDSII